MKGYSILTNENDKLLNVFNNEYGISLKNDKQDFIKDYFKPRNNVNCKSLSKK